MAAPSLRCRSRTAIAVLAAVAALACSGDRPSDHAARLAQAAALGLPTRLHPEWGPGQPRGIACATRMRDARDSTVRLELTAEDVHADTVRNGSRTVTERWSEGEYVVTPAGRYGAARGDTLRVDCGRASAIVPPSA